MANFLILKTMMTKCEALIEAVKLFNDWTYNPGESGYAPEDRHDIHCDELIAAWTPVENALAAFGKDD